MWGNSNKGRRALLRGISGTAIPAASAGCLESNHFNDSDYSSRDSENDSEEPNYSYDKNKTKDRSDEPDESEESDDHDVFNGGAITFIYDDGPIEDFEQAFPAHEKYGVPAATAIVPNWMDSDDDNWMDRRQVRTLQDAGWEIACHTADHLALSAFELVENVEPGDQRIYPEGRGQHGFQTGHPIEIVDDHNMVQRTIVASGDNKVGRYLELDKPIEESFSAGKTVERYTREFVHQQLAESSEVLAEFSPSTFLAPHDVVDTYHIDIIGGYYDGIFNVHFGSPANEIPFDPFDTSRSYFAERVDRAEVYADLKQIAANDQYCVIGAHSYLDEVTPKRIKETLEWCEELGLDVITFEEAIARGTH